MTCLSGESRSSAGSHESSAKQKTSEVWLLYLVQSPYFHLDGKRRSRVLFGIFSERSRMGFTPCGTAILKLGPISFESQAPRGRTRSRSRDRSLMGNIGIKFYVGRNVGRGPTI